MNEPVLIGADRHCIFLQTIVVIPVMDLTRTKFFGFFFGSRSLLSGSAARFGRVISIFSLPPLISSWWDRTSQYLARQHGVG